MRGSNMELLATKMRKCKRVTGDLNQQLAVFLAPILKHVVIEQV